jgi:hypothetical protein
MYGRVSDVMFRPKWQKAKGTTSARNIMTHTKAMNGSGGIGSSPPSLARSLVRATTHLPISSIPFAFCLVNMRAGGPVRRQEREREREVRLSVRVSLLFFPKRGRVGGAGGGGGGGEWCALPSLACLRLLFLTDAVVCVCARAMHSGFPGGITIQKKNPSLAHNMVGIGLKPRHTKGFFDWTPLRGIKHKIRENVRYYFG